ncbi:IPT/TIG domain-containing protein [Tepidibacter formicigenes]|jgi:hypothetical protein|uniref:IPT/TIG domain-containing protein n=1 Tax=Tepidibacter formicigenes DSM 15518 TaxID=1123349 RepID=A0A1M6QZJ2_9FIRM|nr:IPT/TIG domain-containing protein [Tepidibacter formicigenes]SHK25556.1 IPT/TIG domain-containing protein [Tepidibacter formicigenes DSM 15518]
MKDKLIKGSIKRLTSLVLVFLMVFGMMPWQEIKSYAFDADKYYVDYITITKIHNEGGYSVNQTKLTIHGGYLQNATVGTMTSTGYKQFTNANPNTDSVLEFIVDGDIIGSSIDVGSISVPINQEGIPALSNINKRNVKEGIDTITLTGSNLDKIGTGTGDNGDPKYSAYYENKTGAGGTNNLPIDTQTSSQIITKALSGTPGFQNIVLQKEEKVYINFNNSNTNKVVGGINDGKNEIKITIQNTYLSQFRLVNEITPVNLTMNPNRGEAGDTGKLGDEVIFTADSGLDDYDVFFIKNLTDKFTDYHKGVDTTFTPDADGKQVLKTHLPNKRVDYIENGEYYVVITNKIPDGKNPDEEITKQYILTEKFTIIDAKQKMQVISVAPDNGPDTGSKVDISGVFFGTLNIPDLNLDDNTKNVAAPSGQDELMTITYGDGSGDTYKGINVTSVTRTIKVIVGDIATFSRNSEGTSYEYTFTDALDTISVITPQITDAESDPMKDVVIETVTTINLTSGDPVVIKDRAELKDGYTYNPSKITPKVEEITPSKVQVVKLNDSEYKIEEDMLISIEGQNFLIHKYTDNDGKEVVRYPVIELGNDIRLNKNNNGDNSNPNLYLKVFDKNGNELDGTQGNELGTKILVKIPKDTTIKLPGKTFVKVINPIRNTDTEGLSHTKNDAVEFVTAVDEPIIESVTPNIVTVDGGQDITVLGSNFKEGVKVFIDGKEVQGITREGDGKKITFKAPAGREGSTQIQVMNPSGAIAISEFIYVKTYTDPKITSFSPNKGSHGTLVVIKGDNFLKPDPTEKDTDEPAIYKLIGSRILIDGKDINDYNKDSNNKIILKDYKGPQEILYLDTNNNVKIREYYQSIILEDKDNEKSFYTLDINTKGEVVLSNRKNETYTITEKVGDNFKALSSSGSTYYIKLNTDTNNDQIIIEDSLNNHIRTLNMKTPYVFDTDGNITGHRIKIISKNELYFTVPILYVEKWYDITVQNPDTKSDSRFGQNGFYYYKTPKKNPTIDRLEPNQGSTEGGYTVDIYGTDFESNGDIKSRVFIGGVEVPAGDVIISTDKTKITIIMPEYPGNLKEEIEGDRKTVPVVITNSDGGNISKEDGFTYVIPTSNPQITKILPNSGSAAGGEVVQIWGSDFRYFEPYNDDNGNARYDDGEKFNDLNRNGKWDDLENKATYDELKADYDSNILPILPKIYFGKNTAQIIDFSDGYISVKTPVGENGNVDVYILNNDFGTSNKVQFNYKSSNPTITKIVPEIGRKQGEDNIEIHGSEFSKSEVNIVKAINPTVIEKTKPEDNFVLVRFGDINDKNISNITIDPGELNAGTIIGTKGNTKVGDLTVTYDSSDPNNKTINLSIQIGDKEYTAQITNYNDEEIYVPLNLLTYTDSNNQKEKYSGFELVKISIDLYARRVIVERGYSPETKFLNSGQIEVKTPSFYTIGIVPVTVINPDKGKAQGNFEYKNPDSFPKITEITRDGQASNLENINGEDIKVVKVNYKGNSIISIIGTDFRENAKISIGDLLEINYKDITPTLPNRLTFKMPEVDESAVGKIYKVVVQNEDGAFASSDDTSLEHPIYIMFTKGETNPKIDEITPDKASSDGGIKVTIKGSDFRETMDGFEKNIAVYFGEVKVPDEYVDVKDYKTIEITKLPAHAPGEVEVKVENPDGELSNTVTFTYLSNPKITGVVDSNDKSISEISVDGGEEIKIKGSDFMNGVRVVFAPVLEEVEDSTSADIIIIDENNNEKYYKLKEGTNGSEVEFIDSQNIKVKTPQGKLGTKGVIVINPDKSASNIYDLVYVVSQLNTPSKPKAELIYDKYIKITWDKVEGATSYEVYVIVDDSQPYLIGTTELTTFIYRDLEEDTEYKFIVKALGDYGLSKASPKSNTVETDDDVGYEDKDGEISEKTSMKKSGNTANILIGTDDYDEKQITIDLIKGDLAGSKEVIVSMPAKVVTSYLAKDITIIGSDFYIKFNPTAFNVSKMKENKNKSDAGVKFKVSLNEQTDSSSLSNEYILSASAFVGKDSSEIDYLKSKIEISLDFDVKKAQMRRMKNISLRRYDPYNSEWVYVKQRLDDYSTSINSTVDRLGRYSIIGERR